MNFFEAGFEHAYVHVIPVYPGHDHKAANPTLFIVNSHLSLLEVRRVVVDAIAGIRYIEHFPPGELGVRTGCYRLDPAGLEQLKNCCILRQLLL